MQDDIKKYLKKEKQNNKDKFIEDAFVESAYMTNPYNSSEAIVKKQIEILNNAIEEYKRLEDIKRFTKMTLDEGEFVTEEDIQRALELEEKISIDDTEAVKKLLEQEGLINDIYDAEF